MHKSIKIAVLAFAVLFSSNGFALTVEAPAGFKWGQTQAQIKQQGITLENCESADFSVSCDTRTAPKPLLFADLYSLFFVDGRLQKVVIDGNEITGDPSGREGKSLYARVKHRLIAKYGLPSVVEETVGVVLYDGYDEFYQCLAYTGCGLWVAGWDHDGYVIIRLKGVSSGTGWLELAYESK